MMLSGFTKAALAVPADFDPLLLENRTASSGVCMRRGQARAGFEDGAGFAIPRARAEGQSGEELFRLLVVRLLAKGLFMAGRTIPQPDEFVVLDPCRLDPAVGA